MGDAVWRVSGLLLVIATLLACQSTYYDEYRAAHPDFDPELPRVDASLEEVLAALHAPDAVETIQVEIEQLAIYRSDVEPWRPLSFEAIRGGEEHSNALEDYVVVVHWACSFDLGLKTGGSRRGGYYLLPDNRVAAYDHYSFRQGCDASNEFRAARGALVPTEAEALERASSAGRALSLAQTYRRGLAYLEAGRLLEARAMLVIGERGYRASAEQLRAAGRLDALADVERMREALMRALGVEVRQPEGGR